MARLLIVFFGFQNVSYHECDHHCIHYLSITTITSSLRCRWILKQITIGGTEMDSLVGGQSLTLDEIRKEIMEDILRRPSFGGTPAATVDHSEGPLGGPAGARGGGLRGRRPRCCSTGATGPFKRSPRLRMKCTWSTLLAKVGQILTECWAVF